MAPNNYWQTPATLILRVEGDPVALAAGVAGLLALVALTARWIPSARAARVDPIVVLREE